MTGTASFRLFRLEKGQALSLDAAFAAVLALFLVFIGVRAASIAAEGEAFASGQALMQAKALSAADYLVKEGAVFTEETAYGAVARHHEIDEEKLSALNAEWLAERVGARRVCAEAVRVGEARKCGGGVCMVRPVYLPAEKEAGFLVVCVE